MACSPEVKNTVTGKTRKDRRRSGYAGRQSVMPGIVFDVTLPKWLVSTLSWLSVHVRLPTYLFQLGTLHVVTTRGELISKKKKINKLLKDNWKNWLNEILCVSSNSILFIFSISKRLRINATITHWIFYAKRLKMIL